MNIIYVEIIGADTSASITNPVGTNKFLDTFIESESNFNILKKFTIKNRNNTEEIFEQSVLLAKEKKVKLVVNSFDPFQRNYNCISLLHESKVKFTFLDFPALNKKTLPYHLKCLAYSKTSQGHKISSTIKKRKKQGKKQGLENLSIKARKKISAKANHSKKILIYNTPYFKKVLFEIAKLRFSEDLSYQKIANHLNEKGTKSPNGKNFHAKTVERIYKTAAEFSKAFDNSDLAKPLVDGLSVVRNESTRKNKEIKIEGIHKGKNFDKTIQLKIEKNESLSKIMILDKNNQRKFFREYESHEKNVTINLEEIINFYPGIYYMHIEPKNSKLKASLIPFYYKEYISTIKIFKS